MGNASSVDGSCLPASSKPSGSCSTGLGEESAPALRMPHVILQCTYPPLSCTEHTQRSRLAVAAQALTHLAVRMTSDSPSSGAVVMACSKPCLLFLTCRGFTNRLLRLAAAGSERTNTHFAPLQPEAPAGHCHGRG